MPGEGIRIFQIHSPKLKEYEHDRWIDVTWDIDPNRPERFPAASVCFLGARANRLLEMMGSNERASLDGHIELLERLAAGR